MNKDLYNHGTLGVASDGRCQPWKLLGRLEGWDPLLTTEAKIYGLFFCLFFALSLKHCKPSPVQQNSGKDNTAQGEIQTLLIRALWKSSTGSLVACCKNGLKCTFFINGSEAGNEQRW